MAEAMHTEDSEADEDHDKAMIEQIKRDSLKQLEESDNINRRVEDHNVSTTDIFYQGDDAKGFFLSSGETYIYPTNYPIRDYQRNIVHSCLFDNTLVSLPTGLGKTFIAAVVMYNFYRWYPRGKIVFMAPTRPLVSQQMRACYDIMGIPVEDTIELQGNTSVALRKKEWIEKRVFYVTPQTIDNDLKNGVFNPEHLKCLVIDEAHRATKNYAYCQVVQQLRDANVKFRLVALSATPGREIQDVINLIQKLGIAKLELRSENSIDIVPYTHTKKIDSVQVPLSDLILRVREEFLKVMDKYTRSLKQNKVLMGNTGSLSKFLVMLAKDKYVRTKAQFPHINRDLDRMIQRDFHVTHSLASALENLSIYGLRSFYNNLVEVSKEDGSCPILGKDSDLQSLLEELKPKLDINVMSTEYAWSHLKFIRLREILESHFQKFAETGETTKVIIFANYRVVVSEIFDVLKPLEPMVKASMFVGQSSGITQQEQKDIMRKFREGEFNTLIATSVGEEGLDIGEIDLVICFDSQKSPIKLVQRLGRTGRKRNGRCVFLLTQGREAQNFQTSMQTCKSYVEKIINNKSIYASLAKNGSRMIPVHVNPTMRCLHIVVKQRVTPAKVTKKKAKEIEKANKKSKKSLETNRITEITGRASKPTLKKSKKQPPIVSQTNDIRTCFENIAKKKKTFIDFLTQSSGELATGIEDEVVIVEDQLSEFEQMFAKIETWAEKCASKNELIIDDEFFDLMHNFLVTDEDKTPVDLMDVDQMLETENFQISNTQDLARISSQQQRSKSPDFSDDFNMDFIPDVFSPYETNRAAQENEEEALGFVQCSSPHPKLQRSQDIGDIIKTSEAFDEEVLDDGNDDIFLNINSLVPTNKTTPVKYKGLHIDGVENSPNLSCPTKRNPPNISSSDQPMKRIDSYFPVKRIDTKDPSKPLDEVTVDLQVDSKSNEKQTDTSVYQSVDELFASDEDATSPVVENNDIRSYFVSEHEIKEGASYVEPMSISDLFDDSEEDEDIQHNNAGGIDNSKHINPAYNQQHQHQFSTVASKHINPAHQQHKNQFPKVAINGTPGRIVQQNQDWPCSSTPMVPTRVEASKQLAKSLAQNKQTIEDLGATSPDLEDIFVWNSTQPATCAKPSPFTPKQMTQYLQSPDVSEIKSQAIKPTTTSGVKINLEAKFNGTNSNKLFPPGKPQDGTLSPSCEIIFDSDSDEHIDPVDSKPNSHVTSLDGSNMFTVTQLVDMACEREKRHKQTLTSHFHSREVSSEFSCSNKENVNRTPRILDGMDIVDTSDDEFLLDMQPSQMMNNSLIHSYVSTKHLAQPKPKLPETSSVLTKMLFVEENLSKNNSTTVSKAVPSKSQVSETSSDEDLEFFIPKRNQKKEPSTAPKSPLLLSKAKTKPKLTFQKPNDQSEVSKSNKNTTKMSNLSLDDSTEQLDLLIALADTREKLEQSSKVEPLSNLRKPFSQAPFATPQASKPHCQPSVSNFLSTSKPTPRTTPSGAPKVDKTHSATPQERREPPPSQPPAVSNLEAEFGGMTDAQFEDWLKNMSKENTSEVIEEPVTSQYFQQPNMTSVHNVLMNNRARQGPSQRAAVKSTLTLREKETFSRPQDGDVSIVDKSSSSLNTSSVHYISSEDDEDLYFFRTTGKPETRPEARSKAARNSEPNRGRNEKSKSKTSTYDRKARRKYKKKLNPYIEVEADVSVLEGEGMSSDDDLTNSSEDEMDSSFIDDEQDRDQTMAVYLKSVRSPQHGAKFKIPVLSDTVLSMDVYSQAVAPDRTEYLNDSFCVSDEEDHSEENEASLLEIAEARLERERKLKKKKGAQGQTKKPRRRVVQLISSSDED